MLYDNQTSVLFLPGTVKINDEASSLWRTLSYSFFMFVLIGIPISALVKVKPSSYPVPPTPHHSVSGLTECQSREGPQTSEQKALSSRTLLSDGNVLYLLCPVW